MRLAGDHQMLVSRMRGPEVANRPMYGSEIESGRQLSWLEANSGRGRGARVSKAWEILHLTALHACTSRG